MFTWLASSFIGGFLKNNLLKLVMGLGVVLILGTAFFYYNWSQKEINNLRENNAKLENAIDVQKRTIENLQLDIENFKIISKNLAERNRKYIQDLSDLKEKFHKNGRDFGKIAKEKPGLVGRIINDATKKEMDCIEELSRGESGKSC